MEETSSVETSVFATAYRFTETQYFRLYSQQWLYVYHQRDVHSNETNFNQFFFCLLLHHTSCVGGATRTREGKARPTDSPVLHHHLLYGQQCLHAYVRVAVVDQTHHQRLRPQTFNHPGWMDGQVGGWVGDQKIFFYFQCCSRPSGCFLLPTPS